MDVLLDAAGRRRSPVTMPGYHAGRPPGNKGMRYPADPPTVDEIVAVLRHTADDRHGWRIRAMIVVLWRAGLRVQEALALAEHDLDQRRGSLLVRNGKGGRRREVGMDDWGWELLRPWLAAREKVARRPAVLHYRRPHPRASVGGRRGPLGVAPARRPRRREAPLRAPPVAPRARARARPRGRAAQHHPAPTRAHQPRRHQHLPPGHRPGGDHHGGADAAGADDVRQRRAAAMTDRGEAGSASPRLPLPPPSKWTRTIREEARPARANRRRRNRWPRSPEADTRRPDATAAPGDVVRVTEPTTPRRDHRPSSQASVFRMPQPPARPIWRKRGSVLASVA